MHHKIAQRRANIHRLKVTGAYRSMRDGLLHVRSLFDRIAANKAIQSTAFPVAYINDVLLALDCVTFAEFEMQSVRDNIETILADLTARFLIVGGTDEVDTEHMRVQQGVCA